MYFKITSLTYHILTTHTSFSYVSQKVLSKWLSISFPFFHSFYFHYMNYAQNPSYFVSHNRRNFRNLHARLTYLMEYTKRFQETFLRSFHTHKKKFPSSYYGVSSSLLLRHTRKKDKLFITIQWIFFLKSE